MKVVSPTGTTGPKRAEGSHLGHVMRVWHNNTSCRSMDHQSEAKAIYHIPYVSHTVGSLIAVQLHRGVSQVALYWSRATYRLESSVGHRIK